MSKETIKAADENIETKLCDKTTVGVVNFLLLSTTASHCKIFKHTPTLYHNDEIL